MISEESIPCAILQKRVDTKNALPDRPSQGRIQCFSLIEKQFKTNQEFLLLQKRLDSQAKAI
jgi:CRISPR/Cas system-associated protein endoribonuclease Cas2